MFKMYNPVNTHLSCLARATREFGIEADGVLGGTSLLPTYAFVPYCGNLLGNCRVKVIDLAKVKFVTTYL